MLKNKKDWSLILASYVWLMNSVDLMKSIWGFHLERMWALCPSVVQSCILIWKPWLPHFYEQISSWCRHIWLVRTKGDDKKTERSSLFIPQNFVEATENHKGAKQTHRTKILYLSEELYFWKLDLHLGVWNIAPSKYWYWKEEREDSDEGNVNKNSCRNSIETKKQIETINIRCNVTGILVGKHILS